MLVVGGGIRSPFFRPKIERKKNASQSRRKRQKAFICLFISSVFGFICSKSHSKCTLDAGKVMVISTSSMEAKNNVARRTSRLMFILFDQKI